MQMSKHVSRLVLGRQFHSTPISRSLHWGREGQIRVQRVRTKDKFSRRFFRGYKFPILLGIFAGFYLHDYWNSDNNEVKAHAEKIKANSEAIQRKQALKKKESEAQGSNAEPVKADAEEAAKEEDNFELPEEIPEDAVFIPLTFPRELPRTYYKGTDEAWQSFIELARDRKRVQTLRNELAGFLGQHSSRMPVFKGILGQDIKPRKFWIDLDFPEGPPTEYYRIGLEIADEYVAVTTRPVDAYRVAQIKHTLSPKPIALSVWRSYEALWTAHLNTVKRLFNVSPAPIPGIGDADSDDPFTEDSDRVDPQAQDTKRDGDKGLKGPGPTLPPGHPPIPDKPSTEDSKELSPFDKIIVEPGRVSFEVLKHQFVKNWQPPDVPMMVYGSVLFSGFVELVGSKGYCVLDVRASYHPIEARWVTITASIRRTQQKKQRARGDEV